MLSARECDTATLSKHTVASKDDDHPFGMIVTSYAYGLWFLQSTNLTY